MDFVCLRKHVVFANCALENILCVRHFYHRMCFTIRTTAMIHHCQTSTIVTPMIALVKPIFIAYICRANCFYSCATTSCTCHCTSIYMRIRTTCSLACENGIGDTADTEHYAQREEKEISLFHGDFPFCRFIRLSLLSTIVLYGMRQNKTLQFA